MTESNVLDKNFFQLGKFQTRLDTITQTIPSFWDQGPHTHFTLHNNTHSERVYRQRLAQLALELPERERLTPDEIFIVSAAAWLYEIGMQCTTLRPTLDFEWRAGTSLSLPQLLKVREKRHLLAKEMILKSVSREPGGPVPKLGLREADDYTQLIAEVCSWCSAEPLEDIPETVPVGGVLVRVRLLVALLRLADQLDIDGSRVNLDLLQNAALEPEERARWWAYHYTQTLPIESGLIKFYYFLPFVHKDLLDHIRSLIEPDFGEANVVVRYLMRHHHLKLLVDEGGVRYDQSSSFRREMPTDLVMYLRGRPRRSLPERDKGQPAEAAVATHCLVILDFEHFLLQMGLAGYILSTEEINRLLVTLLKAARERYAVKVKALAAGHWQRPDIQEFEETIKELYTPLQLAGQQNSAQAIEQELGRYDQIGQLPRHTILISPRRSLLPVITRLDRQEQSITSWITDNEDDYHFQALTTPTLLTEVLDLPDGRRRDPFEQEQTQAACILTLLGVACAGMSFERVGALLKKVVASPARAAWWRLWLIHKDILRVEQGDQDAQLCLNEQHPAVAVLEQKRQAAVKTLARLTTDSQGVAQDVLFKELARQTMFKEESEHLSDFFALLQREEIVSMNPHILSTGDERPFWQLNTGAVLPLIAERYLPFLVMGLDHEMARSGHPVVHEHTLRARLRDYIDANTLDSVYPLACERKWVCRAPDRRGPVNDRHRIGVEPALAHPEVRTNLLQRDILLDVLYRAGSQGLQRDALWNALKGIKPFILARNDVNQWLSMFQQEKIVDIDTDEQDIGRDVITLCPDTPLVRTLIGRMYIYDAVLCLRRFLHAVSPETGRPVSQVEDRLAGRMSFHGSRMVAPWTLEYGKKIHLIGAVAPADPTAEELLYMKKNHLVYQLDQREPDACSALTEIVRRLSGLPTNCGWAPLGAVLREMARDPLFGYMRNEHNYWINQAIHRARTIERSNSARGGSSGLRVKA